MAAALHERADPRDVDAQDDGHPCHAFVAYHAHFERAAFIDRCEQGNEASDAKVNLPDGFTRLVEYLPEGQDNRFELRPQALIILCWEACQYAIGRRPSISHAFTSIVVPMPGLIGRNRIEALGWRLDLNCENVCTTSNIVTYRYRWGCVRRPTDSVSNLV